MNNIWIYLIIGLVIIYLMRNSEKFNSTPVITPAELSMLQDIVQGVSRGQDKIIPEKKHLRDHLISLLTTAIKSIEGVTPGKNRLKSFRGRVINYR